MTEHRFCCAEAHIQRKKKIEKNGIGDPISVIRDRQRNDCLADYLKEHFSQRFAAELRRAGAEDAAARLKERYFCG